MPVAVELAALSLLPLTRWPRVACDLRRGVSPRHILTEHCAEGAGLPRRPAWTDPGQLLTRAARALAEAGALNLDAVGWGDPHYPALLREIADPPPVLWVSGEPRRLHEPSVALVGSRAATSYALTVAERLAADLSAAGVAVVSGLARGVDAAAHRGALSGSGGTVAVLGCGADVIYPAEHRDLAAAVQANGAIVSEFLPGTWPRPEFFPRRNRLISGLVTAVVVVEAGERSGSLITARCALDQGREVCVVPGAVLGGRNRGGHALLRDGARLVECAADILEEAGLDRAGTGRPSPEATGPPDPCLSAMEVGEAVDLAVISAKTGMSPHLVLARLLELELAGRVGRVPGGCFVRFDRTC